MFRFTIRDVFWLTVVVAMAVGWWMDRSAITKRFTTELDWYRREMDFVFREDKARKYPPTKSGELNRP
jgi:hypothetical protein